MLNILICNTLAHVKRRLSDITMPRKTNTQWRASEARMKCNIIRHLNFVVILEYVWMNSRYILPELGVQKTERGFSFPYTSLRSITFGSIAIATIRIRRFKSVKASRMNHQASKGSQASSRGNYTSTRRDCQQESEHPERNEHCNVPNQSAQEWWAKIRKK